MVDITYIRSGAYDRDHALFTALRWIEDITFVCLLIFFSGAVIGLVFTDLTNLDQENPLARLSWYPIYLIILTLVLRTFPQFFRLTVFNPLLIICVLWCGLSMYWSVDMGITMRRSVALMLTTMMGLVLAARYTWNEMVQRIALSFLILAVISLLVCLLNPARGIMTEVHIGAWRGAFVEKNYLGGMMTKGLIAAMCAFAMRPDRGWLWAPAGILCLGLVVMSTSKTALLISLASISIFIALRIFRRFPILRAPLVYAVMISVCGLGLFVALAPDIAFGLIGKDATFTGRTEIWEWLRLSIKQEWVLGYGYGAYWTDPLGPSYWVRTGLQWGVPSAHNGWIDLWLAGGIVAVIIFGIYMLIITGLSIDRVFRGGTESYWVVLSTLMFIAFSLSESTILQQNDISWVMFVATSAKLLAFEKPFWRRPEDHPQAYLNV
jgi:O-antigen ligase